jgi:hypothetical protein
MHGYVVAGAASARCGLWLQPCGFAANLRPPPRIFSGRGHRRVSAATAELSAATAAEFLRLLHCPASTAALHERTGRQIIKSHLSHRGFSRSPSSVPFAGGPRRARALRAPAACLWRRSARRRRRRRRPARRWWWCGRSSAPASSSPAIGTRSARARPRRALPGLGTRTHTAFDRL